MSEKDLNEPIKFEDLLDQKSNIVKALVYIYTTETIPYQLNLGIRDRD